MRTFLVVLLAVLLAVLIVAVAYDMAAAENPGPGEPPHTPPPQHDCVANHCYFFPVAAEHNARHIPPVAPPPPVGP